MRALKFVIIQGSYLPFYLKVREKVLLAAQEIKMPPENVQQHKKIVAYKAMVNERVLK